MVRDYGKGCVMYEKPLFDGPRFFETQCLICYGEGRKQRWGWAVRFRRWLFGQHRKECETCRGRGKLSYVLTRQNDLMLSRSWEYTTDGFPWVSFYNFNGRQLTWDELDENENAEPIDHNKDVEGLDFVLDKDGRKVDMFTGESIEEIASKPSDRK